MKEEEEGQTEENYKHDSKPLPVSVTVKFSTHVELLGYRHSPTHSVASFPGSAHLPSITANTKKLGGGLETSLRLQDKMGMRLPGKANMLLFAKYPLTERYIPA